MEKGKKYYYDNDKVHQIVVLGTLKDIQPTKRNGRNVYHFENDGILRNFEVEISDEELKNIHEMTTDLNDIEPIKKCMLELNQISTKEIEQNNKETPSVPEKRGMFASVTSMFTRTPEQKIAKIEEKQEKKKEEIKVLDKKKREIEKRMSENQTEIINKKSILSSAVEKLNLIKDQIRIKSEYFFGIDKLNSSIHADRDKNKANLANKLAERRKNKPKSGGGDTNSGNEQLQEQLQKQLQNQEEIVEKTKASITELEEEVIETQEEIEKTQEEIEKTQEEIEKSEKEIEALEKEKQKVETTPGGKRRMKHKLTKKKRYAYPSKISERSSNIFNQNKKTRRFCVKNKQQIPSNYVLRN